MRIQALTGDHDRQGFDCGREELNDWFGHLARQHQAKGLSKTFVAVLDEQPSGFWLLRTDSHRSRYKGFAGRKP